MPSAFTARSISLRSCGHIRGLLTASRGSTLPHSAANGTGSLPTLAAAYRTMPSGFYLRSHPLHPSGWATWANCGVCGAWTRSGTFSPEYSDKLRANWRLFVFAKRNKLSPGE